VNGAIVVSRDGWLRGVVPCPSCSLPLEPQHNRRDYLWIVSETKPYGVAARHTQCGDWLELEFDDVKSPGQ